MRRSWLRFAWVGLAAALPIAMLMSPSVPASAAPLPSNCAPSGATVSCTFAYNGTNGHDGTAQLFTVPPSVHSLTVDAWGAQGGSNSLTFNGGLPGGLGGHARATLPVVPGALMTIRVGGTAFLGLGGFNGGADSRGAGEAGGGGASDVRLGGDALANRVIVAGGGGASGDSTVTGKALDGGAGGGPNGTDGQCTGAQDVFFGGPGPCGTGGTATTGGRGGAAFCEPPLMPHFFINNPPGGDGTAGVGGGAGFSLCEGAVRSTFVQAIAYGAGGGGGWFGAAAAGQT